MKNLISGLIQNALNRLQGAESAIIDFLLRRGTYVQPLRLAIDALEPQTRNQSLAGLYNTLTPYLIDSQYLLLVDHPDSQEEKNMISKTEGISFSEETKRSIGQALSGEEGDFENSITPSISEKKIPEVIQGDIIQNDRDQEVFDLQAQVSDNLNPPGKKKKKQKKIKDLETEYSPFVQWLTEMKPLEAGSFSSKKSKKRKSKKYKLIQETAQKSITPSDEIISESLAKILVAQGHLLEAKRMYKKLLIKHPEHTDLYSLEIDAINKKLDSKS